VGVWSRPIAFGGSKTVQLALPGTEGEPDEAVVIIPGGDKSGDGRANVASAGRLR
jgi:hypothetical protein